MSVITLNNTQAETAGAALNLYDNTTVLVYALDPQYEKEFVHEFYPKIVVDWLKARGMKEGKGWIINHQLIYTGTPDNPPWQMAGLEKYLSQEYPPVAQELPYTDDSSETYPTAQAS